MLGGRVNDLPQPDPGPGRPALLRRLAASPYNVRLGGRLCVLSRGDRLKMFIYLLIYLFSHLSVTSDEHPRI